ncbi:MAG TPA: 50S ribosomal protein L29 [Patescibacteria group bacterium]|nr:50S ribosomal protein L29 [Patescibacteria group bacterium]
MKLKDLKTKDLTELQSALKDAYRQLPRLTLEHKMRKDKNVKKLAAAKRSIAVLSGLISSKYGEGK